MHAMRALATCIICASRTSAFQVHQTFAGNRSLSKSCTRQIPPTRLCDSLGNVDTSSSISLDLSSDISLQSLFVMDVVLMQRRKNDNGSTPKLELGAVQENGNVAPLSTWTLESAYENASSDMMEFVVDEEDLYPGLASDEVRVVKVLDGSAISYGSRQVGGGKGPGNPHGEESELLYYIERDIVEGKYYEDETELLTIAVVVNPNLEHLW